MKSLKNLLLTNKLVKVLEIVLLFFVAFIIIKIFVRPESDNLIYNQAVLWVANIVMLIIVWVGIKIRGETLEHFGLTFKKTSPKGILKTILLSFFVFVLAMIGFIIGTIIMANITEIPEQANMSGYNYLKDNLGMLLLSLAGIYMVSSFGEEVIYRAFLINRISELGLNNKLGRIITITISAVIFGFAHYSWGIVGIVQTTFMGLALAICYLALKKRIWILIIAHAYMDTILMVQLYLSGNSI